MCIFHCRPDILAVLLAVFIVIICPEILRRDVNLFFFKVLSFVLHKLTCHQRRTQTDLSHFVPATVQIHTLHKPAGLS
jgi:hypothetical protein